MRSTLGLFLLSSTAFCATVDHQFGKLPMYFKPARTASTFEAHGLRYGLSLQPGYASIHLGRAPHRADLSIRYLNTNPNPTLTPQDQTPTLASEFAGHNRSQWRTHIPTYSRISEASLYPGIDLLYYGNGSALEYDFVIAPHADPSRIRMRIDGAAKLALSRDGDLVMHTSSGDLVQRRPVVYQTIAGTRHAVDAAFRIGAKNQVSFKLGRYDRTEPLTIDPQISFASFLGDYDDDEAYAVAVDNSGNVYVAGYTTSNGNGDADVLIAAVNASGKSLNYIAQASNDFGFGGSGDDIAYGVAVDGYGSAVVVGSTTSSDFPATDGSFQATSPGGNSDAFLLRLDPAGQNLVYATYLGGSGDDEAWSVKVDALGNTYVTGDTNSTDFPVTPGAFQGQNAGGYDGFIAKFDNGGNRVWATYFGGNSDENSYGIAIDGAGNSYVTGFTDSGNFPVKNAVRGTYTKGDDGFVLKLDPTGSQLVYGTYLGSSGDEQGSAIAVDASGAAYVAGYTTSTGFPVTNGAYQTTYQGGDYDAFVSKLSPDGATLVYSTFIGSHGADEGWGIAVDIAGNAYIVGDTDSDQFPVSGGPAQATRKGGLEGTICELNPQGTALVYSSFLGGGGDDSVQAIALDAGGSAYLVGYTVSSDFPVTAGSQQTTAGGGAADAFVVKYSFPKIAPAVTTGGVVNAGGFTANGPVAPGSIISIFGSSFATAGVNATGVPLATSLGSVSVSINGVAAPLFFVGPTQINAQVPWSTQPGRATLTISTPSGTSASTSFNVAAAAPGIFAIVNQDNSPNTPSTPASAGSVVTVYLTGIGAVDNPVDTGAATPSAPLSSATTRATATINGVPATVQFIGLTPGSVALAQANIVVPSGVTGNVPLQVVIGGSGSNNATISVH